MLPSIWGFIYLNVYHLRSAIFKSFRSFLSTDRCKDLMFNDANLRIVKQLEGGIKANTSRTKPEKGPHEKFREQ